MTIDADDLPDKTLSELQAEDEDVPSVEQLRKDLDDYYEAREELDTMIVATERFLEDIITARKVWARLESLEGEDGLALDRI